MLDEADVCSKSRGDALRRRYGRAARSPPPWWRSRCIAATIQCERVRWKPSEVTMETIACLVRRPAGTGQDKSLSSLINGMNKAITINPTMKPSTTTINGSKRLIIPSTNTLTSSS